MKLHFEYYPCASAHSISTPVIIIPGLFGSSANWRGFAKTLADSVDVYVIDQRNHGRSPHSDTNQYIDLADDLLQFMQQHSLDQAVVCGHSMGGKTAMVFGLLYPERVANLVVLDIAPHDYSENDSHARYIKAMLKIDLADLSSRSQAEQALKSAVSDSATRLFLMLSLAGKKGEYYWRLNLPVLLDQLPEISSFPSTLFTEKNFIKPALFLAGSRSDYINRNNKSSIIDYFPNARIQTINDAGHWLHIDQPHSILNAILSFIGKN